MRGEHVPLLGNQVGHKMVLRAMKQKRVGRAALRQTFMKRALLGHGSHGNANAQAIRAALPQLWRQFSTGEEKAAFTVDNLQTYLRTAKGAHAHLARESKASLRQALRKTAQMPRLQQRLGYRFKDPSDSGTWECTNLVGYSTTSLSRTSRQRSKVSWDSYFVAFRLRVLHKDSLEIIQSSGTTVISAEVEKRPRGGEPLGREMITVTALSHRQEAQRKHKKIKVERRRADLLPAVIYRPVQPSRVPRYTLIYLHGFSSTAFGQYGDAPHYFLDGTKAIKVIVPTAPSRELSIFDAWWVKVQARRQSSGASANRQRPRWRLNQFNSWFDYLTNADGKKEDSLDIESLHVMQKVLHKLIWDEAAALGGHTDRVILGGKSQGCCTALDAALTFPHRLGGFIGVVGHLLGCTPLDATGPQVATPLHFLHEVDDYMMNWAWVQPGMKKLKSAGYKVYSRRAKDPEGNGHYVGGGFEGRWIRQALNSICK